MAFHFCGQLIRKTVSGRSAGVPEDGSGRFGESARCRSGAARPVALCTHAGSRVCVCVMICVSFVRAGLLHVACVLYSIPLS